MSKSRSKQPRGSFYGESDFTPLVETLRNESQDYTPLTDEYVGFYRNVTDMISPDAIVNGIKFDKSKNALVVTYSDGTTETIVIPDNFLKSVSYVNNAAAKTHKVIFTLNNNEVITTSLDGFRDSLFHELKDVFYTKEEVYTKSEVDEMIDNIDSIKWIPLG